MKKHLHPLGNGKSPIIIAKAPGREKLNKDKNNAAETSSQPVQPTFILKTREGDTRAVSPSAPVNSVHRKHSDGQLTPKPSEQSLHLSPMKNCVKLVDDTMQLQDSICEYMSDQMDYLVVGCIGMQGVGKSTVLSYLAGCKPTDPARTFIFKPQKIDQQDQALHCTSGIDMYITSNRIFLLDCQPFLSASVLDHVIQQEKKHNLDFPPNESGVEIHSLQIVSFLLSVCHVVLLVQDWITDPSAIRFVQSAEMLKPATATTTQDEVVEYFPHFILLHNRAQPVDFEPTQMQKVQDLYKHIFAKSRLTIQGGNGDVPNVVYVPEYFPRDLDNKTNFRGYPSMEVLLEKLRAKIFGLPPNQLACKPLSEKNWFHYAVKTWENVKKCSYFHEYHRLLP